MIEVTHITDTGRREVLATRPTFTEAKAYVQALGVVHMEDDSDYADCADAYLNDGRVVAIQPVGFKVSQ